MSKKGILAIISGFSGVGKGTMVRTLADRYPDRYAVSVSATTREPREGEMNGIHYHFITDQEFQNMAEGGELLEYAGYVGHYYGTPAGFVHENLSAGRDVILEIEVQGAKKVKEIYPDALMIFIIPPSFEILKQRLKTRGTEDEETIARRLARASEEAQDIESYEYVIVNDILDSSVDRLHQLIQSSKQTRSFHQEEIDTLRAEISAVYNTTD